MKHTRQGRPESEAERCSSRETNDSPDNPEKNCANGKSFCCGLHWEKSMANIDTQTVTSQIPRIPHQ
jgi:hypothetical protein